MLSYVLIFYAPIYDLFHTQGRRFDRGDRAGDVFRSIGETFDVPMSTGTKVIAILMLISIAVFSTYLAIRLIRHIWHSGNNPGT
ncbi:MAG: hypothetical protein LBD73_03090 [Deferribacteraceae bacterium]|jgi:hypothetical protein|nr:hypothetical protein [Deferribacteraceae bacterium]